MEKPLVNYQLPIGNRLSTQRKQLPIALVDTLADELTREYSNPDFRRWYCGVIYEFGLETVHEWRSRACEGKEPARLFSKYVQASRRVRGGEVRL